METDNSSSITNPSKMSDFELGITYNVIINEMKKRGLDNISYEQEPKRKRENLTRLPKEPPIVIETNFPSPVINNNGVNNILISTNNKWTRDPEEFGKLVTPPNDVLIVYTSMTMKISALEELLDRDHDCKMDISAYTIGYQVRDFYNYFAIIMCNECVDKLAKMRAVMKEGIILSFALDTYKYVPDPLNPEKKPLSNNMPNLLTDFGKGFLDPSPRNVPLIPKVNWDNWKRWRGWKIPLGEFLKEIKEDMGIIGMRTTNRNSVKQLGDVLNNYHKCPKHINAIVSTTEQRKDLHIFFAIIMCKSCADTFVKSHYTHTRSIINYVVALKP